MNYIYYPFGTTKGFNFVCCAVLLRVVNLWQNTGRNYVQAACKKIKTDPRALLNITKVLVLAPDGLDARLESEILRSLYLC